MATTTKMKISASRVDLPPEAVLDLLTVPAWSMVPQSVGGAWMPSPKKPEGREEQDGVGH